MLDKQLLKIITIFIIFTCIKVSGQSFKKHFKAKVSVGSMYDDNVLKYSDKYLTRFLNNSDQGRFDIKTYDDLIIKTKLGMTYSFKFINNKKTKISTSFQKSNFINNPVKNWNIYSVGIQQYLSKQLSFKLLYSFLPNFYVRNFRVGDYVSIYGYVPTTFKQFTFSKDDFSFWVQNIFLKNTKARITLRRQQYYNNMYYTEYDAKNSILGLKITQKLTKNIKLSFNYQYIKSDAKGYNQEGETKENSNEADASFDGHKYEVKFSVKLPKIFKKLKNNFDVKTAISQRIFSSEKFIFLDPLHSERLDNNINLGVNYNLRINKKSQLKLFYNYYQRKSSNNSTILLESNLSNEKNYKQNQVGLLLSYSIY